MDRAVDARQRLIVAWALTLVGLPAMILSATLLRSGIELSTALLATLAAVLGIAALGGRLVGAVAAVAASLVVNWYFIEPLHTFTIGQFEHLVALVVFLAVAITVGSLVDTAARRAVEAGRARAEAELLALSAARLASEREPLPGLIDHIRSSFGLDGVRVRRRESDRWVTTGEAGDVSGAATTTLPVITSSAPHQHQVELFGRLPIGDDRRILRVLSDQLAVAVDAQHLSAEAAEAAALADIDAVRTALLRAVSHDLRTPLASIKAMVSGLRDRTVSWTPDQLAEALATIEEETDRLNRLVGNLLDASRLQIGALAVDLRSVALGEAVAGALSSLGVSATDVVVEIADDVAPVVADAVLLERSLANVVANAIRHSPPSTPVRVSAAGCSHVVRLEVVDHGPGIAVSERSRVVAPFQRLGDQQAADGVGLGLSIAQGFVEAMHGRFLLRDTAGGGLTICIELPAATTTAADAT